MTKEEKDAVRKQVLTRFSGFYDNAFVKELSGNDKWTVSDKKKRPLDMHQLIHNNYIVGAKYDQGYNPLVTLPELLDYIPNAANHAYLLDSVEDGFVVLDVEPTCPEGLRNKFLKLPYLYGEVSMSGKGLHLVFRFPDAIAKKYPVVYQKTALKSANGTYEILLNHMVTFTRNVLPEQTEKTDITDFYKLFELLAATAHTEEHQKIEASEALKVPDRESIPSYKEIFESINSHKFNKKPQDFPKKDDQNGMMLAGSVDNSRYEYNMANYYLWYVKRLIGEDGIYKGHKYTDDELAKIVYYALTDNLEHREKHDTKRNGMPYLMYTVTACMARSYNKKDYD